MEDGDADDNHSGDSDESSSEMPSIKRPLKRSCRTNMILSDKEEEGEEEEEGDISVRKLGGRYRMGWVGSDSEE